MRDLGETSIWIYATVEGTFSLLQEAQSLQMLTSSYDYTILNPAVARYPGALKNFAKGGAKFVLFNLQPISIEETPTDNIYDELSTLISFDSVAVLRSAWTLTLNQTSGSSLTPENLKHNCNGLEPKQPEAEEVLEKFMEALKQTHLSGMTGNTQFDSRGHRTNLSLEIHTMLPTGETKQVVVWDDQTGKFHLTAIPEPTSGGKKKFNRHLIITSILEPPFLMLRNNGDPSLSGNNRFEGYCVDLADMLAYHLGFTFEIRLVADYQYGSPIPGTNTWNGMIGEVMRKEADLAIAALTINSDRQKVVAFSKPFMDTGISIMIKKPHRELPGPFSFLDPFSSDVWCLVIIAYCAVSLFLFMEARFSASEWQDDIQPEKKCGRNPTTDKQKHNNISFANSCWFSLVALLQQGTNFAPKGIFVSNKYRSPASQLVGTAWWFFTIIITSHYIAYLARFINVERLVVPVNNADELAAQKEVHYGTRYGGSTYQFFNNSQVEVFRRMWDSMNSFTPSPFVPNNWEGVQRVRQSNGKYAFLIESNMNNYLSQQKPCDTLRVGPNLDSRGYGIAAAVDSTWIKNISLALLRFEEDGSLERLETAWWIDRGECGGSFSREPIEHGVNSVGLSSLAGVFYIFLCGLGVGLALAVFEFLVRCFTRCCTKSTHQPVNQEDLIEIDTKQTIDNQAEPPGKILETPTPSGKGKRNHNQETTHDDVTESTA